MNMMMTQKERKQLAEVIKRRKNCEEKIRPDNVKIIMTSIKKRLSSPLPPSLCLVCFWSFFVVVFVLSVNRRGKKQTT